MAEAKKKENVEVEFTPEQKNFQAHIQSLSNKISKLQFEIDESTPKDDNFFKKVYTILDLLALNIGMAKDK
jgi:peptidoglycan hydrolase CwlO-like protein